jgi:hypothetical protein
MSKRSALGSLLAILFAVGAAAPPCPAADTVGARLWYAQWDVSYEDASGKEQELDFDAAPMFVLQYSHQFADQRWLAFGQVGYGEGWGNEERDTDDTRLDVMAGGCAVFDWFRCGLAYRYMQQDSDYSASSPVGEADWTGRYHGPELLAQGLLPLVDRFKLSLQATWQPFVFWSDEYSGGDEGDGTTWAYSLDGGLVYSFERYFVQLGYRWQHVEEDTDEGGGITDDDFHGPYLGVNFTW